MNRDDILQFFRKGLVFALPAMLAVSAAVYLFRKDVPPTYSATTTLYVADNVLDMRSMGLSYLVAPALHVGAYRVAAFSDPVIQEALQSMGVDSPSQRELQSMRGQLNISTDADSRLIYVDAVGGTALDAADTANALAQALLLWDAERPRANLRQMIVGLQGRIADLDVQIEAAQLSGNATPNQASSLINLRSEQLVQLSTAVMLSDAVVARLETVQWASVPVAPIAPSPVFESVVAGLLAFAVTYLGLLLWTMLDPRVRDIGQISLISGLPILAAYPPLPKPPRKLPGVPTGFLRAAVAPQSNTPKVVLLTDIGSSRSVTRIAIGLAESFANAGYSTLLVSANSASSDVTTRYQIPAKSKNLIEAQLRAGFQGIEPVLVQLDRGVVLGLLTGFETGDEASEQIANSFRNNIRQWSSDHQVIIIDTPPLFSVADALSLTPFTDEVVVVLDRRSTNRKGLFAATDLLERHGVRVAGAVVTNVPSGRLGPEDFSTPPVTSLRSSAVSSTRG